MRVLFMFFNKTPQAEIKNSGKERAACTSFMLSHENPFLYVTLALLHHRQADREASTRYRAKTKRRVRKLLPPWINSTLIVKGIHIIRSIAHGTAALCVLVYVVSSSTGSRYWKVSITKATWKILILKTLRVVRCTRQSSLTLSRNLKCCCRVYKIPHHVCRRSQIIPVHIHIISFYIRSLLISLSHPHRGIPRCFNLHILWLNSANSVKPQYSASVFSPKFVAVYMG